jgi:transcriptional regulator
MYDLPHHKEKDQQVVKEFITRHPFAFLTGCDSGNRPVATQVPVFIEERDGRNFLSGHIMKNTTHHKAFSHNAHVLAVFTGRHTYVSATWYSNPHVGSTWNYMSVQARGIIRFLDADGLKDVLRKTSLHFENNNGQSATAFDNLPSGYTNRLLNAIVAFEIEVTDLDHVFKLSQDRDAKSYQNIIEKLKEQDEDGRFIAGEMEKRKKALFPDIG